MWSFKFLSRSTPKEIVSKISMTRTAGGMTQDSQKLVLLLHIRVIEVREIYIEP